MQFSHFITSLAAFAAGSHAAAIGQRQEYNVIGFRVYSSSQCTQDGNQGEWTVHKPEVNTCLPMASSNPYKSILGGAKSSDAAWADCKTTYYTDGACSEGATDFPGLGKCVDAPQDGIFQSLKVACPTN